jgi:hypothetical protein
VSPLTAARENREKHRGKCASAQPCGDFACPATAMWPILLPRGRVERGACTRLETYADWLSRVQRAIHTAMQE